MLVAEAAVLAEPDLRRHLYGCMQGVDTCMRRFKKEQINPITQKLREIVHLHCDISMGAHQRRTRRKLTTPTRWLPKLCTAGQPLHSRTAFGSQCMQ